MKIFWIVFGVIVVVLAAVSATNYLLQRLRQKRAQREGIVVYATLLSIEAAGGLAKHAKVMKIALRVQDPGSNVPREVTIRTRVQPNQKLTPGMKIAVAIDPKNPKVVYPADPEASKRIQLTGSRLERRQMRSQGFSRQQPPAPRYQPPIKTGRR